MVLIQGEIKRREKGDGDVRHQRAERGGRFAERGSEEDDRGGHERTAGRRHGLRHGLHSGEFLALSWRCLVYDGFDVGGRWLVVFGVGGALWALTIL